MLGIVIAVIFKVVVTVDVAGEGLAVFVTPLVYPATNTVANTIVIINITKNCGFIFIFSFGENFARSRGSPQNKALRVLIRTYGRVLHIIFDT
jgi:hypothetical protein